MHGLSRPGRKIGITTVAEMSGTLRRERRIRMVVADRVLVPKISFHNILQKVEPHRPSEAFSFFGIRSAGLECSRPPRGANWVVRLEGFLNENKTLPHPFSLSVFFPRLTSEILCHIRRCTEPQAYRVHSSIIISHIQSPHSTSSSLENQKLRKV